jgi:hypothetical protein
MHAESTHAEHEHMHGPSCGHTTEQHGDHIHYMHDGHAHRQHADHWDECSIEGRVDPLAGAEQVAITDEQARPRGRDEMAEELRTSTGP